MKGQNNSATLIDVGSDFFWPLKLRIRQGGGTKTFCSEVKDTSRIGVGRCAFLSGSRLRTLQKRVLKIREEYS